jgi:predicted PhzF superfamily epimerase YddE/YHI9
MRRRNEIFVEVLKKENGEAIEKVFLSGNAVKVMEGSLEI